MKFGNLVMKCVQYIDCETVKYAAETSSSKKIATTGIYEAATYQNMRERRKMSKFYLSACRSHSKIQSISAHSNLDNHLQTTKSYIKRFAIMTGNK